MVDTKVNRFANADQQLLETLAAAAAIAIENARLFKQIQIQLDEITEMRDLMNNVFESIASGVITTDQEDQIALFNKAASNITVGSNKARPCIKPKITQYKPAVATQIMP